MVDQRIRLNNGVLFDGYDYFPEPHSVTVAGDRIIAVEAAHPARQDERVIDLAGRTIMPGLIDAHFHANSPSLNVAAADRILASHMAQYARRYLEEELLRGFTTVRDAGGADPGLARAVEDGLIRGPRLFVSGRALSQTGGHGDFADGPQICGCSGYSGSLALVIDGADAIRRHVREQLRLGVHQIKIFVSGGVLSPSDPLWMDQFTDDEIRAAVEESSRRRTYVMAHAHTSAAVRRCVTLGVRSIEHALLMDAESADIVAHSSSYVVPTLSVVTSLVSGRLTLPKATLEKAKVVADSAVKAIEYGDRAGVRFGFGTDLLGELHGSELEELNLRAAVSGTLATLRSATSINAEIMNMKGEIGVVRPGAKADLIVVDGNPLADIGVFTRSVDSLKLIMKDGIFITDRLTPAA